METQIVIIASGLFAIIILLGQLVLLREIKKGNKDQQEIKTRLTWIKKRQLYQLDNDY